jgi:hypothetical protein
LPGGALLTKRVSRLVHFLEPKSDMEGRLTQGVGSSCGEHTQLWIDGDVIPVLSAGYPHIYI